MVKWEGMATMGENPASVEMDTGILILNRDVFPKYSQFTQQFIIEHERGHYNIPTDDEAQADFYALRKLYKSTGNSLRKTMKAITDFLDNENPRVRRLYIECLRIDKENNKNKKATKKLEALKDMQTKKSDFNAPLFGVNYHINHADGGETEQPDTNTVDAKTGSSSKSFGRSGRYVNIFGYPFTIIEIVLVVLTLRMLFTTK